MVFGHMEPQMTKKMWWWYFESKHEGTVHIPCEDFTKEEIEKENEGDIEGSIGFTVGFGVRMSAPGYLDCTAWEVFEDEADAQATYDAFAVEIEQDKYEAGAEGFARGGMTGYNEATGRGVVEDGPPCRNHCPGCRYCEGGAEVDDD